MTSLREVLTPRGAWNRALDALFPPRCAGCRSFGAHLCADCLAGTQRADGVRCLRCWMPGRTEDCARCRAHPSAFAGLRSAFVYGGAARKAVHALKFNGLSAIAPAMAAEMARVLEEWRLTPDVIVPVPLGAVRRRTRGYNQSELLAREIGRRAGIPVESRALVRARRTAAQAQQADESARRANIAGAFAVGARPARGRALLIDDVATTGATLSECARVLLDGGATQVLALTFARED